MACGTAAWQCKCFICSDHQTVALILQLEKYHEQAQLLDPHVPIIVERLTAVIRQEALRGSQANQRALQQASEFLWALVTVRSTSRDAMSYPCEHSTCAAHTCRCACETGSQQTSSRLNRTILKKGRI